MAEIEDFFESTKGRELSWLKEITLWDQNGEIVNRFSRGGIPLTVLIDGDGIIRLNESGAFLTEEQLRALREKIAGVLK